MAPDRPPAIMQVLIVPEGCSTASEREARSDDRYKLLRSLPPSSRDFAQRYHYNVERSRSWTSPAFLASRNNGRSLQIEQMFPISMCLEKDLREGSINT